MRPIDYFDAAASVHADRLAVIDGSTSLSFADLQRMSHGVGGGLTAMANATTQQAVAIISQNDHRLLACVLGIMRAGHAIVPVHVRSSPGDVADYLTRTSVACVFYHSAHDQLVRDVRTRLASTVRWVCLDSDAGPDPSLEAFAATSQEVGDWGGVREDFDRPVYLRQTSGTTGKPKLVVDDIASFNASTRVLRQVLSGGEEGGVFLAVAPLSHACGVFAFNMLTLGATVVIMAEFDAPGVFRRLREHRVTHLWLPPTALYLLLDAPEARSGDWTFLRSLVLGAAAVSPEKLKEAVATFGPCVSTNYSQVESGFLTWLDARTVASAIAGDRPERLRSSGRTLGVARYAIMADDAQLCPANRVGEIVARGASVKNFCDPEDAADVRRDGWHHTGDLGYVDSDGYLYVVGRTKDVIVSSGFKIAAAEVEQIIMELGDVRDCAVVGAPDALRGEVVVAVVSMRDGRSADEGAVVAHCRRRLGVSKAPRTVEYWPDIPKTPVGKTDKLQIRARLSERADAASDRGGPSMTASSRTGERE